MFQSIQIFFYSNICTPAILLYLLVIVTFYLLSPMTFYIFEIKHEVFLYCWSKSKGCEFLKNKLFLFHFIQKWKQKATANSQKFFHFYGINWNAAFYELNPEPIFTALSVSVHVLFIEALNSFVLSTRFLKIGLGTTLISNSFAKKY